MTFLQLLNSRLALHFPWDATDDYGALRAAHRGARAASSARSTRTSSRTPTTSSARSRTRTRACAEVHGHLLECLEIAAELGATAQSLFLLLLGSVRYLSLSWNRIK